MVQKPVKSKSPQPLPIVKPVFSPDIHVISFMCVFPEIIYACIACVYVCILDTLVVCCTLLDLAFSFHEYVGDYSIMIHVKLPHLFNIAATCLSFRGSINKTLLFRPS